MADDKKVGLTLGDWLKAQTKLDIGHGHLYIYGKGITSFEGAENLPPEVKDLDFQFDNGFDSLKGVEKLPPTVRWLQVTDGHNMFGGNQNLLEGVTFPETLEGIYLEGIPNIKNQIKGVTFPTNLKWLGLRNNYITDLDGINFPPYLERFDILGDELPKIAGLDKLPNTLKSLVISTRHAPVVVAAAKFNAKRPHVDLGYAFTPETIARAITEAMEQKDEDKSFPMKKVSFKELIASRSDEAIIGDICSVSGRLINSLDGVDSVPKEVKKLFLNKCGIETLENVRIAEGIEYIGLGENPFETTKGIILPNSLKELAIFESSVKSIAGTIFPKDMEKIALGGTKIESLVGVVLPPNLKKLSLARSPITSLEGVTLPDSIEYLNFYKSKITSLNDVKLPACLKELSIGEAAMTSLVGVEFPAGLEKLNISGHNGNTITSLEGVKFPASLKTLNLSGNPITSLTGAEFPDGITELNLGHCKIASYAGVKFPESAESLTLSGDGITNLDEIDVPSGLKQLWLMDNKLTSFDGLDKLPKTLTGLDVDIPKGMPESEIIKLAKFKIERPEVSISRARISDEILALAKAELEADDKKVGLTFGEWLKGNTSEIKPSTYARRQGIASLEGIQDLSGVSYLCLDHNGITNLEGVVFPAGLESLSLIENPITSLAGIEKLPKSFRTIYLPSDLAPEDIIRLYELKAQRDIDIASPDISPKAVETAKIEVLAKTKPDGLITFGEWLKIHSELFDLTYHETGDWRFDQGKEVLFADRKRIGSLQGIENLPPHITSVHLTGNEIKDFKDVSFPPHLKDLYLPDNKITTLEGAKFNDGLKRLALDRNKIVDCGNLEGLPKGLTNLSLEGNYLSSGSIAALLNLYENSPMTTNLKSAKKVLEVEGIEELSPENIEVTKAQLAAAAASTDVAETLAASKGRGEHATSRA